MENEILKEISEKLDKAIRLLAINITLNKKQNEQIESLNNAGFKPKEIAVILGTTANTIRVGLAHIRKSNKKK